MVLPLPDLWWELVVDLARDRLGIGIGMGIGIGIGFIDAEHLRLARSSRS